ncbi:hypothetical protein [Actinosynnema sp. NPDC020468]|uniref:hypothetical protein n=1 Tax=Actinosynnema sp. NPDC020468 TaxID=3154488 RepID=UPI0033F900D4
MSGLALRAAGSVVAPPGPGHRPDAVADGFLRDLLEPFGEKVDEELFRSGNHVTHKALTDLLLALPGVGDARPGLVLVAHALPDVLPFTVVAPYLAHRLGVRATAFSVTQQGLAAPFTALRIAAAHQRTGHTDEVVLAVLEQTTLPAPVSHPPAVDSAAVLVFAPGGGPRLVGVSSGAAADLVRDRRPDDVVVLGPWVDLPDVPAHRVPPGSYCTSVWLALAENWARWREGGGRVVLCDTDPRTGVSHAAVFDSTDR